MDRLRRQQRRRNPYADFNGSGTLLTRYVSGPAVDEIFARTSSGGTTAWYLTDRLGSVRDIVNTSGTSIDHVVYDSYGNILTESSGTNGDRFKFTGMEYAELQPGCITTGPGSMTRSQGGSWSRIPSNSGERTKTCTAMLETDQPEVPIEPVLRLGASIWAIIGITLVTQGQWTVTFSAINKPRGLSQRSQPPSRQGLWRGRSTEAGNSPLDSCEACPADTAIGRMFIGGQGAVALPMLGATL